MHRTPTHSTRCALRRSFLNSQKETYSDYLDLIDQYFDPEKFERELESLPGPFGPPHGALLLATVADANRAAGDHYLAGGPDGAEKFKQTIGNWL